jgi:hypothetical protein
VVGAVLCVPWKSGGRSVALFLARLGGLKGSFVRRELKFTSILHGFRQFPLFSESQSGSDLLLLRFP